MFLQDGNERQNRRDKIFIIIIILFNNLNILCYY
jgi:hypothetical protein